MFMDLKGTFREIKERKGDKHARRKLNSEFGINY